MRRAFLLAGIAAGAVALFTTVSVTVSARQASQIQTFKTKLADLTFCRTGYDIASSRPHYIARFTEDAQEKADLIELSDVLLERKEQLDQLISDHLKEAKDLPLDAYERSLLVEKTTWEAELDAVHTAGWVQEPEAFLDHLLERCEPYINE
jgi:hypothetical protein